jgi:predicted ester cyclase
MILDVAGLLDLWTRPPGFRRDTVAMFRNFYTDAVRVNGYRLTVADLAERARSLQAAFTELHSEILTVSEGRDSVALAFQISGRQVGELATAAGVLPPTGRLMSLRVIDILHLSAGRIDDVTMVSDELRGLAAIGAVTLARPLDHIPTPFTESAYS